MRYVCAGASGTRVARLVLGAVIDAAVVVAVTQVPHVEHPNALRTTPASDKAGSYTS